ncbi:MAG TPA: hypothetical protein DCE25_11085 [Pseudomonas sp.]|nr:hypothetical protein [Pseudomonas sp.]
MTLLKSVDVEIVSTGDNVLPAAAQIQLSLLDVSLADAPSVALAQLNVRCAGLLPARLSLSFDANQIDPRHSYALAVRIEQDGKLLYINTTEHPIDLPDASGTQRVVVDKVASAIAGIHGGNVPEGIHGGNRLD